MTQLYLQRFEYRAATKSEFDQAWAVALQNRQLGRHRSGRPSRQVLWNCVGRLRIAGGRRRRSLWPLPAASRDELRPYGGHNFRGAVRPRRRHGTARRRNEKDIAGRSPACAPVMLFRLGIGGGFFDAAGQFAGPLQLGDFFAYLSLRPAQEHREFLDRVFQPDAVGEVK